jgi:hypothetical protein
MKEKELARGPHYPLGEFDGSKWAEEFMRLFGHRKDDIDEGLMLGWFCNAIMTGFDEHARRHPSQAELVAALRAVTDLLEQRLGEFETTPDGVYDARAVLAKVKS